MRPHTCPTEQQLQAFQLGNLPEPSLDQVAAHLETCLRCETLVQRLDAQVDPILVAIRDPGATSPRRPAKVTAPEPTTPSFRPRDSAVVENEYPFLRPPERRDEIGRLGNYRILRLLGKGGMGFVFQAEDMILRRPVALKIMKRDMDADLEGWQRFLREARIMASLKHPNLVTVFQVDQEGDVAHIAMELLQGESFEERCEGVAGPGDVSEILRLGGEIAGGLGVIHQHGLVHRDIKPANLWLESDGRVKILDFGLARHVNDDAHLTRGGSIMGTPAFMSPEQARGAAVDARSDLFSLGCVLYCLCTGKRPFDSANTLAILTALAVDNPPPVHELNPAIPRTLSDLVMQLLSKDAANRPESADMVLARLRQIGAELSNHPLASVVAPVARLVDDDPEELSGCSTSSNTGRLMPWIGLAAGLFVAALFVVSKFFSAERDDPPLSTTFDPAPIASSAAPAATPVEPVATSAPPVDKTVPPVVKPAPPVFEPAPPVFEPAPPAPDPVPEVQEDRTFLCDLKEIDTENWPYTGASLIPRVPIPDDTPTPRGGAYVIIKGKLSPHGIFMHGIGPPGGTISISYQLDKQYRTFHADVSLNDGPPKCSGMVFTVYGDEKPLWQFKPVRWQTDRQEKMISVEGVEVLKIEMKHRVPVVGAQGAWFEPYLVK